MIRVKTKSGVKLRTLFETISPLLVEGTIEFSAKSMRVRGSNQISFCDALISADEDETEFEYNWPTESHSIGVSFETIHSCLSAVSPNDSVAFFISTENQNCPRPHITLSIESTDIGYVYEDSLYLLMLESQVMEDADRLKSFDKLVSMSSTLLLRVLRNSAKRSDGVQIYTRIYKNKEKIYFRSDGDDASLIFSQHFESDVKSAKDCLKKDIFSLKFLLLVRLCQCLNFMSCLFFFVGTTHHHFVNSFFSSVR